ncbi:hypothetical protein EDB19DRAFT_1779169, partial [Suillus lakei]
MHFSKTYLQLLLTLLPELHENAIQYHQLKNLINQLVQELSSLGLSPTMLQQLLEQQNHQCDLVPDSNDNHQQHATMVYEFTGTSSHIESHLRLCVKHPTDTMGDASGHMTTPDSILEALQFHSRALESNTAFVNISYSST